MVVPRSCDRTAAAAPGCFSLSEPLGRGLATLGRSIRSSAGGPGLFLPAQDRCEHRSCRRTTWRNAGSDFQATF